jgi:hypothetical protein
MNATNVADPIRQSTPWHLWPVGILALLWNGSGALTILLAQAGRLPDVSADEAAYYASQPLWFVVVTDIALFGALAAALALLLRSRAAVWLFAVSLVAILATNTYDLAAGGSRALANGGALAVTILIVAIAILELGYARALRKRAVLR